MTRIALLAGLATTIALSLGTVSAQAYEHRRGPAVVRPAIVAPAYNSYHNPRQHRRHHWYRFWR